MTTVNAERVVFVRIDAAEASIFAVAKVKIARRSSEWAGWLRWRLGL
jgi:hypothetical protein